MNNMKSIKEIIENKKYTLVDVRNAWEFEEGHAIGAINIPLDEIPARLNEFKKMDSPVLLYCRSGNRSGMANLILKQNGFENSYNAGSLFDLQQIILN
jgi:rhodanese-related sulfurtransferase